MSESSKLLKDLPNALSIFRAVLGLFLPILLFQPSPIFHGVAFVIFILGAITDFFDGYLARRFKLESSLGKIIDPTADKVLILAPLAIFAHMDLCSVWWLALIFIREIAVTFCRIAWSLEGRMVGAEKVGKLKFGFQVTAVGFAFLYYFSVTQSWLASWRFDLNYFLVGLLFVTTFLTIYSGVTFFMNNRQNFKTREFAKFCSAAGVGLIPVIPGTWGSLVGLAIGFLARFNPVFYGTVFVFFVWLGFWSVARLGLRKEEDPGFVVLDEVCGMMLAMFLIPFHWVTALAGFVLFRIFDIIKPFPVRYLERLPGFWGILLDDLGAGVYTWFVLFWFCR